MELKTLSPIFSYKQTRTSSIATSGGIGENSFEQQLIESETER